MADYLTLTEFVPGTKAKAQEVNANFSALKDAVSAKAALEGDSTQKFAVADGTDDSHAINKGQLDELSNDITSEINKMSAKFCVKSGNTTDGKGDLFSYSLLTITSKIAGVYDNLVMADYQGTQTTISTTPAVMDLTGNSDGEYNIFINTVGELYILDNTIYRQAKRPTMVVNDIWFNTSVEPFECIKYSGTSDIEFLDVPLGKVTIDDGTIIAIETFSFNQNGHDVNIQTNIEASSDLAGSIGQLFMPDYAKRVSKSKGVNYTAESNGYIVVYNTCNSTASYLTINGIQFHIFGSGGAAVGGSSIFPVATGDTYICSNSYDTEMYFIQMRSV